MSAREWKSVAIGCVSFALLGATLATGNLWMLTAAAALAWLDLVFG